MKFSELIEKVRGRGVVVNELRVAGQPPVATPWSSGAGGTNVDPDISGVQEDSRKVRPGDLFVARDGTRQDGGKYIVDALNRGAVALVGEMIIDMEGVASASVADANLACAILAHEVAGNPTSGMKMIGITGTKGKTTVAYLLRSVLKAAGHKVGMIGTVEIDDGVRATPAEMTTPGSVELVELFSRMKKNGVTHCVMEVSSHALHQHRVAGIDFAVGVFTNLTGDHLDYHKTMEEYAAAKAMLFEGLKEGAVAVVNADDAWAGAMVARSKAKIVRCHVEVNLEKSGLQVAGAPEGGWSGLVTRLSADGMQVNFSGPDAHRGDKNFMYQFQTPLVGRHNAYNLICAVAGAFALGLPDAEFMHGMRTLEKATGAPGRLQAVVVPGREKLRIQVFVDYAHTHDALENVLRALRTTMEKGSKGPSVGDIGGTPMPRLICLFGCGGDRDRTKRPKMARAAELLADRVIVTSDNPRTENPAEIIEEICSGFSADWKASGKITVEPDRRAAIRAAIGMAREGDVVLLAGKGHENYQIIATTKHHFDDVEEAKAALQDLKSKI